jgi:hypothetical protein
LRKRKPKTDLNRFSFSTSSEGRLLVEEGVALLEYRVEVPSFAGEGIGVLRMSAFYAEIARRCIAYAEGGLADAMRKAYLDSEDPQKRFRFRRAQYRHAATAELNGGILSVRRSISLLRGGKLLFEQTADERWRISDGRLLPDKKRDRKSKE